MIRRIVAGIILGFTMFAAAAMVARASKAHPQAQMGTLEATGH